MASPVIIDLPPNKENTDILSILEEQNEDIFVDEFVSNLKEIFSCDKQTIITHLEGKHAEDSLFQLQSRLHELVQETFPHYVGSKVIRRKRK